MKLIKLIAWAFNCSYNDVITHLIVNNRQSADIVNTVQEINENTEILLRNRRNQITTELTSINSHLREAKPDPNKASRISVVDFEIMNKPLK